MKLSNHPVVVLGILALVLLATTSTLAQQEDPPEEIDIHEKGAGLRELILAAARDARLEGVTVSDNINAQISCDLYGVTFTEMLDMLGFFYDVRWHERGGTVMVVTQAEYEALELPEDQQQRHAPRAPEEGESLRDDDSEMSVTITDLDVGTVCQLLSIQQHVNFLVSPDISGRVTVAIENATPAQVLDAVLIPNGWNWIELNNAVYVVTQERYEQWQAEQEEVAAGAQ